MKNQNKLIIESLINLFSIFFALYVWKFISLPYEKVDIIGEYSENSYNSLNEFLRYFIFILFPTIIFFASKLFLNNASLKIFF